MLYYFDANGFGWKEISITMSLLNVSVSLNKTAGSLKKVAVHSHLPYLCTTNQNKANENEEDESIFAGRRHNADDGSL